MPFPLRHAVVSSIGNMYIIFFLVASLSMLENRRKTISSGESEDIWSVSFLIFSKNNKKLFWHLCNNSSIGDISSITNFFLLLLLLILVWWISRIWPFDLFPFWRIDQMFFLRRYWSSSLPHFSIRSVCRFRYRAKPVQYTCIFSVFSFLIYMCVYTCIENMGQ